jgi:endo-1,4-beta-mannosidase
MFIKMVMWSVSGKSHMCGQQSNCQVTIVVIVVIMQCSSENWTLKWASGQEHTGHLTQAVYRPETS